MKVKERSKEYVDNYLKSSNLYPLADNHQRAKLIKIDLYRMGKAHQDGYRQAINDVCDFLIHELVDNLYFGATHRTSTLNKSVLIDRIKKNAYE